MAGHPAAARTAAVFVPSMPMLLPAYVGRADPVSDIRETAVRAVADALPGVTSVVIVADGRAPLVGAWTGEPLGVRIGQYLLDLAGWAGEVIVDGGHPWDDTALHLVVGDGSAKRSEKAPGHLDPRSFEVDAAILTALESADPTALSALDLELCDELLVTGARALTAVADALRGRDDMVGEVRWSGDPYGVQYWVAGWSFITR